MKINLEDSFQYLLVISDIFFGRKPGKQSVPVDLIFSAKFVAFNNWGFFCLFLLRITFLICALWFQF